jgi:two-component system LytT family response regulator
MISTLIVDNEKRTPKARIYHLKPQTDLELIAEYRHTIRALEKALQSIELKPLFSAQPCFIRCYKGNLSYSINAASIERVNSTSSTGVNLMTKDGQEHHTNETLKGLEEKTSLVRCHLQHLVNMDCIKMVEKIARGQGIIHTYNGFTLPVSRRRLETFKL